MKNRARVANRIGYSIFVVFFVQCSPFHKICNIDSFATLEFKAFPKCHVLHFFCNGLYAYAHKTSGTGTYVNAIQIIKGFFMLQKGDAAIKERIEFLTNELEMMRPEVLERASSVLGRLVSIQSLHGIIGGKNNEFVDCVRMRFPDADDFFARWLKGFVDKVEKLRNTYSEVLFSSEKILKILGDKLLYEYTQKFFERNYYKQIDARQRVKPDESLWEIWFGDNNLVYGLFLAPAWDHRGLRTDKSGIRRANYRYWTIGHVMATGFIVPNEKNAYTFKTHADFYDFYRFVVKQLKKSEFEKEICDKYIDYLSSSSNVNEEPFLIPEFRYLGLSKVHKYRLDFTVLNQYTEQYVGFEISPASSHMAISRAKGKTQKVINEDLKIRWEKEMDKRNEYYKKFGISIVSFTDNHLEDIDVCFETIRNVLRQRPPQTVSIQTQMDRLKCL